MSSPFELFPCESVVGKRNRFKCSGSSRIAWSDGDRRRGRVVGGNRRRDHDRAGRTIKRRLLQSNPILESFGNAWTARNNNSLHLGKYIEIGFDDAGRLRGASADTYLLEKVRLISQAPVERSYHVVYKILAGGNAWEREQLRLDDLDARDFLLTARCGVLDQRNGVKDADTFSELRWLMRE